MCLANRDEMIMMWGLMFSDGGLTYYEKKRRREAQIRIMTIPLSKMYGCPDTREVR